MKGRGSKIILCVILVGLAAASSSWAANGKSSQVSLKGLKGVGVIVERLSAEVEKEGLVRDQLQEDVESKLRLAGIPVLGRGEIANTPGEPYLYINVNLNLAKTESDVYPYSIDAALLQKVSLLRDAKLTTYGTTWSTGGVGSISKELVGQLRDSVMEILDMFINAYRSENPK